MSLDPKMPDDDDLPVEVLYEFRPMGRFVKVCAIDANTGMEITMVGDSRYGDAILKRIARRKLAYVIAKNRAGKAGK